MRERSYAAAIFLAFVATSLAQDRQRPCPTPRPSKDEKYTAGQIWSYKFRPEEGASTITILRVESFEKLGTVVHVRINDVHLKNCQGASKLNWIAHAPFAKDAIDRSVLRRMKSESDLPNFKEGYEAWRSACGGAYTISIAEMLNVVEKTYETGSGCPTQK